MRHPSNHTYLPRRGQTPSASGMVRSSFTAANPRRSRSNFNQNLGFWRYLNDDFEPGRNPHGGGGRCSAYFAFAPHNALIAITRGVRLSAPHFCPPERLALRDSLSGKGAGVGTRLLRNLRSPAALDGSLTRRRLIVPNPLAVLSITGNQLKEGDFQLSLVPRTVVNFRAENPGVDRTQLRSREQSGNAVACRKPEVSQVAGVTSTRLRRTPLITWQSSVVLTHARRHRLGSDERYINQMLAQKPHLKLVHAQHFADKKVVGTVVTKFYRPPCLFASLADDDLVRLQQA